MAFTLKKELQRSERHRCILFFFVVNGLLEWISLHYFILKIYCHIVLFQITLNQNKIVKIINFDNIVETNISIIAYKNGLIVSEFTQKLNVMLIEKIKCDFQSS